MSPVFIVHNELPSTHEYAISLVSKTTPDEATVIVAGHQTEGKGRYDRRWSSEADTNLLLSCILYPRHLEISQMFYLNIISTLATASLLDDHGISPIDIKWPNDVLVAEQKIAGTLIQNQFSGVMLSSAIISIGLNVNQLNWSNDIQATSMRHLTNKSYEVLKIGRLWVQKLIAFYQISRTRNGLKNLKQEWKKNLCCYNTISTFKHADRGNFTARLLDVLDDGKLVLHHNGTIEHYHMDEVRHLRNIE